MNLFRRLRLCAALLLAAAGPSFALAQQAKEEPLLICGNDERFWRHEAQQSLLASTTPEVARDQAWRYLCDAGKDDATTKKRFDAIWADAHRTTLDRVADSLALGNPEGARLLALARDSSAPAPTEVPLQLKDAKQPVFFRANLGLAYARALSSRHVHEEALDVLRLIKPNQVVDPGAYFFHRAVAEHALLLNKDAARSLAAVQNDVADVPERYQLLANLMQQEMTRWQERDLGAVAREMKLIERRLDLSRAGPETQKRQKDVVARLDEIIKALEKEPFDPYGPPLPPSPRPVRPMPTSQIAPQSGPGNVENRRLKGWAQDWGKLPEMERAQAIQQLIRDLPPQYREVIEEYFRQLARASTADR